MLIGQWKYSTNTALSATGAVPGAIAITNTTGLAGNDNNTISYCNVHSTTNIGACIYSGSNSAAGTPANNDNNTIDSCNIYDYFIAASASAGIDISIGNNNTTISNNRFFQTATRTYTSTQTIRAIWMTPNTGSLTSASGNTISGNFIGGNSSNGSAI